MTFSQALIKAYPKLRAALINSAYLDAELLLSFVLSARGGQEKSREWILAHPEIKLSKKQIRAYDNLIKQRARHVPIAYITREKEFYGRPFYIDERVLVPRPETEMMAEEILCHCEESRAARGDEVIPVSSAITTRLPRFAAKDDSLAMTIVDVGTGSGCIIITLAKELQYCKNLKFFATDISSGALAVARQNARLHGVDKKIKFLRGNLLQPLFLKIKNHKIKNFFIVANLPYLTPAQIQQSPTIKHEPKLALNGGADGLKYYRQLAVQLRQFHIKYPNISISLFCEIDPAQSKKIKTIFSSVIPANAGTQKKNNQMKIKKDLAGRNRIAIVKF